MLVGVADVGLEGQTPAGFLVAAAELVPKRVGKKMLAGQRRRQQLGGRAGHLLLFLCCSRGL